MLLTELSTILALVLAILALGIAIFSYRGSRRATENVLQLAKWTREANEKSASLKRIAEISAEQTELKDAYDALLRSHKKLRARIGMREVRQKRNGGSETPAAVGSEDERERLRQLARDKGLMR